METICLTRDNLGRAGRHLIVMGSTLVDFMCISIYLYIELQRTLANLLAYDLVDVTQKRDLILHALPLLAFLIE